MCDVVAVLVDIRSVWNVGSMFRTADAAGISKVYLVGFTPTPFDRFGNARADFAKVSLGAEAWVQWEHADSAAWLIRSLKDDGYTVCTIEQSEKAIPYTEFRAADKVALVVGNEVTGLPVDVVASADRILEIPMRGAFVRDSSHPRSTGEGKESLNVAVAFGIVAFHVTMPNGRG
jgi:23S rRNA (guanosine2251-2'-O)-methyltransferase